jgi:hypothetical protein
MVKILYILIAFLSINTAFGQITYSPEEITILGNPSEELITFKLDLTNTGSEDEMLYWKLEKEVGFPSQWATQICDFNLCYGENIDEIATSLPNVLKSGETRDFKIYLLPNNFEGEGKLIFRIYKDAGLSDEIITLETNQITVSTTTSIKNIQVNDIKIYPNPSSEYFQITNDEKISKIILYNMAGKTIRELNHYRGQSQNIDFLKRGIYLVRLFNDRSELIKTMRIQKN